MERCLNHVMPLCSCLLVGLALAVLAADVQAQLLGRRFARRDLEAMEEYYDDLEDYYEDRNPRLAREAERMEKYYKDLRKGRTTGPPPVVLPGLRLREPLLRRSDYNESQQVIRQQPSPQAQARWKRWGASEPAERPAQSQMTAEAPLQAASPAATLPTERTVVRRAPTDNGAVSNMLRFPPSAAVDPVTRLQQSHGRLVDELERLARRSPAAAAQWMDYLGLPESDIPELTDAEFFTTVDGRERLATVLEHFDRIASDSQFRAISQLGGFETTRTELRSLLASLQQQPTLADPDEPAETAEELPTPPAE